MTPPMNDSTPADDLLAQTHGTRLIGNRVVVVDEGVENLPAGGLGAFLAVVVADVLERTVFVLQFEVIPVFAPDEDAGVAVFQFKVMDALEDLQEGFPVLRSSKRPSLGLGQAMTTVVRAIRFLLGILR